MAETSLDHSSHQQPGGLVPVKRQIVRWQDGVPVVDAVPMMTPVLLNEIGNAALAEPYSEPDDEIAVALGLPPSEFYGRPLAEVMLIRQARHAARSGDTAEVEAILDRRLGKPKTTAENHNINETYEQACQRIAKTVEAARVAARVAAATPVDVVVDDVPLEDLL